VSKLFRTQGWMTVAQLAGAWGSELTESGEDPTQCEQNLVHILMVDIINGRLDDSGPLVDGQRLGLRLITPESRAAFIEGPELLELIRTKEAWLLHRVVIRKEAVLDFAQRHQLPSPSWWTDSPSTPTEVPNDTKVNFVETNFRAVASRSGGKQSRILKLLSEHFPDGVPEPGLCPRQSLKSDILKWDPSLAPLDEATLKKAIDKYNADFSKQRS
jgi:hypothetical protein